MAMIKCTECGKEVSSLAKMCPNCGAPISDLQKVPVYFKRKKKLSASKVSALVFINGQMVGSADNGAEFTIRLSPGTYQIAVKTAETGYVSGGKTNSKSLSIPSNAKSVDVEVKVKESMMGAYIVIGDIIIN